MQGSTMSSASESEAFAAFPFYHSQDPLVSGPRLPHSPYCPCFLCYHCFQHRFQTS